MTDLYVTGSREAIDAVKRLADRAARCREALALAAGLLADEGYDTDPDYTREWQTISASLEGLSPPEGV